MAFLTLYGKIKNFGFSFLTLTGNCALYFILIKINFKNYKTTTNILLFHLKLSTPKILAPGASALSPLPPKTVSGLYKLQFQRLILVV